MTVVPLSSNLPLLFGVIFFAVVLITYLGRMVAMTLGFVSIPRQSRWSQRTVALGGGVAILLGIGLGFGWVGGRVAFDLGLAVGLVFLMGFVDDVWGLPPVGKLFVQTAAAAFLVSKGYLVPTPFVVTSIALTILWMVGMSNSLNLLDNMDGLAAGITLIASLGFAVLFGFRVDGGGPLTQLAIVVAAASAGFLVHNFNPARVFMGDAGSLPLGLLLGFFASQVPVGEGQSTYATWLLFPMVLVVPLFDTCLVMVARRNANRPLMSGGRDHSSHRIVQLGLSERRAVLMLYLLAALGSLLAWWMIQAALATFAAVTVAFAVLMTLLGVFLLEIVVYPRPQDLPIKRPLHSLPTLMLYFLELALDICVITSVWTLAHVIRFMEHSPGVLADYMKLSVIPRLPALIIVKIGCFLAFKLYRGVWRTISKEDVYRIFKAVSLASVILILGSTFRTRLQDLSRIAVFLDWQMTFIAILGTRAAYSLFRRWSGKLARVPANPRAALLISPDWAGEIVEKIRKDKKFDIPGLVLTKGNPGSSTFMGAEVLGESDDLETIVSTREINVLYVERGNNDPRISQLASAGVNIRRIHVDVE